MAHVELVDQTFRDGQQSLWGLRLRTRMVRGFADDLEHADYRAIDITGSTMFETVVRYLRENPWEDFDLWRKWMPTSYLRAGVGSNRIAKFGMTPDSLIDLWVQTLIKHGMNSFWVYDCLYNMDQMRRLCRTIHEAGGQALGAIMYGISPVHTDEWWAVTVREMVSWPEVSGIYFEDAPGILTPERAETLVPALLAADDDKPIEFHCHNNTGMGAVNYVKAVELGARVLHTCSRPLANGPSLPSTEQTLENLRWMGHETSIDEGRLPAIAEHCARVDVPEGHPIGAPNGYNVFAYSHHLPGGMTGTLKAQLAQQGMQERLPEVLEECVRVREEMGHPVSATPFFQLIGIQSVMNIVTGERWSAVPDEVIIYLMGKFGEPPAPMDENVRDKVLSSGHGGRRFADWERPQPSLEEVREQYGGSSVSDEELLLRYMVPEENLEAAYAAGPVEQGYEFRDESTLRGVIELALSLGRPRHLRIDRPDLKLTLKRAGDL